MNEKEIAKLVRQQERDAKKTLIAAEKEARRIEREQSKAAKLADKEARKLARQNEKQKTEADIVFDYANRIVTNQRNHGRIDKSKFKDLANKKEASKNLWMDTDFYFSVVFQSGEQKRQFLNAFLATTELQTIVSPKNKLEILNGLVLAKALGIQLDLETSRNYPLPDLDLKDCVLDNEIL